MTIDLNSDLGEGEGRARTLALMRWISSANIACGGHAGDADSVALCIRLAKDHGVRIGAHPGPWSTEDAGRGALRIRPDELELLLLHQVSALQRIAGVERARLHHIKLHGALYHAAEDDVRLASRYLQIVKKFWPRLVVYGRAGGWVERLSSRMGVRVWPEAFLDRGYQDDGSLVPRSEPGALVETLAQARQRARTLMRNNTIETVSGRSIPIKARTVCVHSDTPGAARFARAAFKTWSGGG